MLRTKKIVEIVAFSNTVKDSKVIIYATTKLNDFLKTISADDYISHEVDRSSSSPTIRLTYKKTITY